MKKQEAFTLAEVLVTLAIIGIVAAMTIPTLISTYKKHTIETKLKKFYSTMNQAIKLSEVENGEIQYWKTMGKVSIKEDNTKVVNEGELRPIDWFNTYLAKYIKTLNVKELANTFNEDLATLYFFDGSAVQFDQGAWLFFPNAKDVDNCYKLDNPLECSGNKYFYFYLDNANGLTTANWSNYWLSHNCPCSPQEPIYGRAMCTTIIRENNWKIPDDYFYKF